MSLDADPPPWKLPRGVNASLWRYAHTPRLADDEAAYFANDALHAADGRMLDSRFTEPGPLVDLGSGTGRLSLHFARKGFPVTAVDLSGPMLHRLAEAAHAEGLGVRPIRANLCALGCLPDRSFAYSLSMFSTLGMIRGAPARARALAEAFRVLRPGGRLALHAHNVWLNLRTGQGRSWLVRQLVPTVADGVEPGDRRMTYRGIPGREVHLYRWGELRRGLTRAGFRIEEVVAIDAVSAAPILAPWLLHGLRAGGWVVFARRPG
jgi:ubiquinone/menaquinone biosynthesis C-methylase UbiE